MLCPFCKENVADGATVCEFCESQLPAGGVSPDVPIVSTAISNAPIEGSSIPDVIPRYKVHTICLGMFLVVAHYELFRFIPLFLAIFYIPFMSGVGYFCYVKFIRNSAETTSVLLARYCIYSGLIAMLIYQVSCYGRIAKFTGRAIISTAAGGLPVPFLGTIINYGAREQDITEAGTGVVLFLNAIPALELIVILLLLYIGIRLSKTGYELQQQGSIDPFAKAAGLASTVNIGLSQLTLAMHSKGDFEADSVEDAALREKLSHYASVAPSEQCVACDYSGPMGIIRTSVPWYLSWWLLIPLACTGVGMVWVAIAVALRFWKQRLIVECPMCGVHLETAQ